ncbi:Apc13p protein-domain-containing protein [Lipomyces kononenkoae]|uniref:Apc13p protein-domain-containing protein n=1 Tax=Lipomyces kononenkoae TaxID=34357 RepID=A0ACC3SU80_LIPKO
MPPRDSSRSHIHLNLPRSALFFEDWVSTHLPDEEIVIPPEFQPINPEDEDDVVPDQHAAFGILLSQLRRYRPAAYTTALHGGSISAASAASAAAAIATASPGTLPMSFLNASAWKDLDLQELMHRMPDDADEVPQGPLLRATPYGRITSVAEFFRDRREDGGGVRAGRTQGRVLYMQGETQEGQDDGVDQESRLQRYPRHARSHAGEQIEDEDVIQRRAARQTARAPR